MFRSVVCSVGFVLSLFAASCTDMDMSVDEAELALPDAGPDKGIATSPSLASELPPVENIGGGGECDTPDEAERPPCNGGGGSGSGTCSRVGQACPPPPHMPHDAVCSYEQRPEGGCVCRCFVPGGPALTGDGAAE